MSDRKDKRSSRDSLEYLRAPLSVARVTFQEIIRDKVLYNILLCAALLMGIAFLAAKLSVTRHERIILDFGLTAVSLSSAAIAIFTGSSLIGREFDRRTIFVALSRPISRFQFVFGKFLGLAGVLAVNWLLLSLSYLGILGFTGWDMFLEILTFALVWALVLVLMQSVVLASLAFLFSSFTTTSLSAILTVGFFLVGNNISQIRLLAVKSRDAFSSTVLIWVSNLLPNLEHFNLGLKVSYGLPVTWNYIVLAVVYGLTVICVALFATGLLINRREA